MEELLALAATQFGLFTRTDAHDAGLNDAMLQRRVRSGMFEQVSRRVYRVAGSVESWHQRLLSAVWSAGLKAVASHRSAGALHRYDGFRPGIVEITVPRKTRFTRSGVIVHQSTDLVDDDCTVIDKIPVTNAQRTLIDTGIVAGFNRLEEGFDGAERDGLIVIGDVERRHTQLRRRGRNGVGPSAVCLETRLAVNPHSPLERRFVRLLQDAGLPTPVCQHPVRLLTGRIVRIDCAYVDLTLGYELDGHGTHATRAQRAADHVRAGDLGDVGWEIRRFTYEQVMKQGDVVVRKVRATLAARSKLRN